MPKTFDEAMLEFQKLKVQATKSSKNPHFKNQYASLEDGVFYNEAPAHYSIKSFHEIKKH